MLAAMRKNASSTPVKILLGVLIVSFAVWGIGDVLRSGGNTAVIAEVEGLDVDVGTVNRAFEDRYRQLQQAFGGSLDRQTALAFGLLDGAVQTAIAQRLVDVHTGELGLGVSDEEVRRAIRGNPAFGGPDNFSRAALDFYLQNQGLNEEEMIVGVRDEIRRRAVITAMSGISPVPQVLQEKIAAYRQERRDGTALIVKSAAIQVEEPGDDVLQAHLDSHADNYQAPEYRRAVLVQLRPHDLQDEIEIDEATLRRAYDERIANYTTPEQRRLGQLLAPDQETGEALAGAAQSAEDFAALAEDFADQGVSYSTIGPVTRSDLPEPLAEAAFAVEEDGISALAQSDFGFHIFKAIEITPGETREFDEVREELKGQLALLEASRQLPGLAGSLDDEIAAGETLEAAAQTLALDVTKLGWVDANGLLRDGGTAAVEQEILGALFTGEVGIASLLEQTRTGTYYVYRIDEIEAPRPLSLGEARDDIFADWQDQQRIDAASALAMSLLERAQEGATLRALANEQGNAVDLVEIAPVLRSDSGQEMGINRTTVEALFGLEDGSIAAEPIEVPQGFAVLQHGATLAFEPGAPGDEPDLKEELADQMRNDLLAEYENLLRDRYSVQINQRVLDAYINSFES